MKLITTENEAIQLFYVDSLRSLIYFKKQTVILCHITLKLDQVCALSLTTFLTEACKDDNSIPSLAFALEHRQSKMP